MDFTGLGQDGQLLQGRAMRRLPHSTGNMEKNKANAAVPSHATAVAPSGSRRIVGLAEHAFAAEAAPTSPPSGAKAPKPVPLPRTESLGYPAAAAPRPAHSHDGGGILRAQQQAATGPPPMDEFDAHFRGVSGALREVALAGSPQRTRPPAAAEGAALRDEDFDF